MDSIKKEFEIWAESRGLGLYCSRKDLYEDTETLWAWSAWKASRKTIVIDLPKQFKDADCRDLEELHEAIHSAGIRTK